MVATSLDCRLWCCCERGSTVCTARGLRQTASENGSAPWSFEPLMSSRDLTAVMLDASWISRLSLPTCELCIEGSCLKYATSPTRTGRCLRKNTPFTPASSMKSSNRSCSPAPNLVLYHIIFPRVFFSRGVFFHRHRYHVYVCWPRSRKPRRCPGAYLRKANMHNYSESGLLRIQQHN